MLFMDPFGRSKAEISFSPSVMWCDRPRSPLDFTKQTLTLSNLLNTKTIQQILEKSVFPSPTRDCYFFLIFFQIFTDFFPVFHGGSRNLNWYLFFGVHSKTSIVNFCPVSLGVGGGRRQGKLHPVPAAVPGALGHEVPVEPVDRHPGS